MSQLIVIDSSAVLSVLLNEPMSARILQITVGADLISPASLPYEIANALSARVKANNTNNIALSTALLAYQVYQSMPIRLMPIDSTFHIKALQLATTQRIYAYDAYLLLLAQQRQAPLLTLDGSGKKQGLIQQAIALGIAYISL